MASMMGSMGIPGMDSNMLSGMASRMEIDPNIMASMLGNVRIPDMGFTKWSSMVENMDLLGMDFGKSLDTANISPSRIVGSKDGLRGDISIEEPRDIVLSEDSSDNSDDEGRSDEEDDGTSREPSRYYGFHTSIMGCKSAVVILVKATSTCLRARINF
ncbi:hypothetical protein HD806DRAFT_539896 [Xylariaceae sp. AK1471]|nr:hypothetical protein HD806DRAFT_539896 [Xylariaceae sp. AK1471]